MNSIQLVVDLPDPPFEEKQRVVVTYGIHNGRTGKVEDMLYSGLQYSICLGVTLHDYWDVVVRFDDNSVYCLSSDQVAAA